MSKSKRVKVVLKDTCVCGHGRETHTGTFGRCFECLDVRRKSEVEKFTVRPGVCDRFTWDPKGEEGA